MSLNDELRERLSDTVNGHRVVLFMKGKRRLPQCGFSAQVVKILDELVEDYQTVNVLEDPDVREGIKSFSSWPTIPQLYVEGKFVGGCDIVSEMYQSGQLHQTLGIEIPDVPAPRLTATPEALEALQHATQGADGRIRLQVDASFRPSLGMDEQGPLDFTVELGPLTVLVDRMSATRADGLRIDFVPTGDGGFRIENPNQPPRVHAMSVAEAHARRQAGHEFEFIDVRTPQERETARIEGTRLFTDEERERLRALPKDTPIVFHCHHGGRSMEAAQGFAQEGFWRVYNLEGGIDAWSLHVDNSLPRY
jgi:monothiol glutaredoxin